MKKIYMLAAVAVTTAASVFMFPLLHKESTGVLTLESSSFKDNKIIPIKFTCLGENSSPELHWKIVPQSAIKSYVLIVDDPDAQRVVGRTFVHWIVLLDGRVTELPEGISSKKGSSVVGNGVELLNDFHTTNYGGPCPPRGSGMHTYRFTLCALVHSVDQVKNNPLCQKAPFTAEQFEIAYGADIIAQARIVGKFEV